MSYFLDHSENILLHLYKDTADSFARLENTEEMMDKRSIIHMVGTSLEQLINAEMENTFSLCEFDLRQSLFSIRTHLLTLEKQHTQTNVKNASLQLSVNEPSQQLCTITSSKHNEKNFFQVTIANLQTHPRVKNLQEIAGLADVKKVLTTIVILPLYQPQLYQDHKICNSVLLYGPPGTGKTLLAHALAAEISAHFLSVTSSDILSQYVGQTEKMLQALFATIKEPRSTPTILFIDEVDGLCRSRTGNESEWGRRLKTELMCQFSSLEDARNTFLICATNCPWDLDTAFLRRFQRRIYIPLPDAAERRELLELLVKNCGINITSISWWSLINRTENYSGADLADVVRNALNIRITELIDTKIWKKIDSNKYQPVSDSYTGTSINCNFFELPTESIVARDPHVGDLMAALDVVRPTVSDSSIKQYINFMKNT